MLFFVKKRLKMGIFRKYIRRGVTPAPHKRYYLLTLSWGCYPQTPILAVSEGGRLCLLPCGVVFGCIESQGTLPILGFSSLRYRFTPLTLHIHFCVILHIWFCVLALLRKLASAHRIINTS